MQVRNIRVAAQEPEQLVDDGAQMQFLGRNDRKTLAQIETHLIAEHAESPGTGPIIFSHAGIAYMAHHR